MFQIEQCFGFETQYFHSRLLEKCWQILLYVTDDAIAKLYVT